jgi:hypothetical protein
MPNVTQGGIVCFMVGLGPGLNVVRGEELINFLCVVNVHEMYYKFNPRPSPVVPRLSCEDGFHCVASHEI